MKQPYSCRFCGSAVDETFADLGVTPLCQTHIAPHQLNDMEPFFPLHAKVCSSCFLVQLEEYVAPDDIFVEYAYFSSYSDSWLKHASDYCDMVVERFQVGPRSFVVEIASNDGYLLRNFVDKGIPCLGVEPAANVADAAREIGVETVSRFFGRAFANELSKERGNADLLVGNNVLAHVPDLNDFVAGLKILLAEDGVVTMEFPHLQCLMDDVQFDTIYHEHFSYFSFTTVCKVFEAHGLRIFDVDQLKSHGGSLRIFACHAKSSVHTSCENVDRLLETERANGFGRIDTYRDFQRRVNRIKFSLLEFLVGAKKLRRQVVGYGAPGKGNTLLNFCGVGPELLSYTVDRNPYKQGKYTPGTRIPILDPETIRETKPDYVLILPWNLKHEIARSLSYIKDWHGKLVVPLPRLEVSEPEDLCME